MKFDDLDTVMRVFETRADQIVPADVHMVSRLDGRGFTRLTKERHNFERPFDVRFRDHMAAVVEHLMNCGFPVVYGYTQSDEISLLMHPTATVFGRKVRKYNSILAGEASAKLSLLLSDVAVFDCRICQLPTGDAVRDYFRWRAEDAFRNALNAHCYWLLRCRGESATAATRTLQGMSVAKKRAMLYETGVEFDALPPWQLRGSGFWFEEYEREGVNPISGRTEIATRKRFVHTPELPDGTAYDALLRSKLGSR